MLFYAKIKHMATKVFKTSQIILLNNQIIECSPLKIKYMREFMDIFIGMESSKNDDESIEVLLECSRVCMKQYNPSLCLDLEDHVDLNTLYDIVEIAAGIKIKPQTTKEEETPIKEISKEKEKEQGWFDLDLAKLEAEVFTLGIWKNYEELEISLSIPELMQTLSSKEI